MFDQIEVVEYVVLSFGLMGLAVSAAFFLLMS
ncbi:hypothetical protein ACVILK_006876 [Bradyrhizobium embrapense]